MKTCVGNFIKVQQWLYQVGGRVRDTSMQAGISEVQVRLVTWLV